MITDTIQSTPNWVHRYEDPEDPYSIAATQGYLKVYGELKDGSGGFATMPHNWITLVNTLS